MRGVRLEGISVDYRNLSILLIKIAGVVMIVYAIINIPAYISYYFSLQTNSFWAFVGMSVAPMFIPLIAGVLFFTFPETVTNRLIRDGNETNKSSIDVQAVEQIAFSAIGLYLLFRVISDFVFHATSIYLALRAGDIANYNTGYDHPYALVVATIAELAFALYLLFGSESLSRFLRKLRSAETQ